MKILVSLAQALSKQDYESKISDLGSSILDHLIKILKWDDPVNVDKHIKDVNKWLVLIRRYKMKNNVKPKAGSFYKWLFKEQTPNQNELSYVVRVGLQNYHSLPDRYTDEELFTTLDDLYKQLDKDLIAGKQVDIRDYLTPLL